MDITVIGTGYVGLVSGACSAELGKRVICVDMDVEKIASLQAGRIPIYEPGLDTLVRRNVEAGRLKFSMDLKSALSKAEVVILAVGTPTIPITGRADLSYVFAATEQVASALSHPVVIVTKSTVPVGTGKKVQQILDSKRPDLECKVVSNPEFLREGSAVDDFLHPDRIVIGVESEQAKEIMMRLYHELAAEGRPILCTNIPTAEFIKYAANAFLATKIAFTNEMADICEEVGADMEVVVQGMAMDTRIGGKYMQPGPGYGGSCFPKDTRALLHIAMDAGTPTRIVQAVVDANESRKERMVIKIKQACNGTVEGKKLAILGLTFKANTDDIRYSPSLVVVPRLVEAGAEVRIYDPVGMSQAQQYFSQKNVHPCSSWEEAVRGADGVIILTEWEEFTVMNLKRLKELMRGCILIDLRNILNKQAVSSCGFKYVSIGRPVLLAHQ